MHMPVKSGSAQQAGKAIRISLLTALLLAFSKLVVGLMTHSMAVMASALDSFLDSGSSLVNLIAVREASRPPDPKHTYGHEKIESLAALLQSLFIGFSGAFLVWESVKRLWTGQQLESLPAGMGVMLMSLIASIFIVWRLGRASHGSQSMVLSAESLHYSTDIISNGGILVALFLVHWTGKPVWDLIVSLLIAIHIFISVYRIFRRSVDELLDSSLPIGTVLELERLIKNHHPSILGFHNFRSRRVGEKVFMDFHVEMGEENLKNAHQLTTSLIAEIQNKFPGADVTVHYDPAERKS